MKRIVLLVCVLAGLMILALQPAKVPQAKISNGIITASLYPPDAQGGYYRATRFDWSGVISSLDYKGHSYFGQWFSNYSPEIHDAIMGPVEEFTPDGYEKARTGEAFLKPGIGMLIKPDDTPYSSFKLYKIKNPGDWKVEKGKDQMHFTHLFRTGIMLINIQKPYYWQRTNPN